MLTDYVAPISKVSARDILTAWLWKNAQGMDKTEENARLLAVCFPGYVRTDYLLTVWEEMDK